MPSRTQSPDHGQRIGRERPALRQRWVARRIVKYGHQVSSSTDGTDRQPTTDDLAQCHQIRLNSEPRGGTVITLSEIQDLITYEDNSMTPRDVTNRFKVAWLRRDQSGAGRHHVNDEAGQISAILFEQSRGRFEIVERDNNYVIENRRWRAFGKWDTCRFRVVSLVVRRAVFTDFYPVITAMIRAFEFGHLGTTCNRARRLDREHHGLGPGIDVADPFD